MLDYLQHLLFPHPSNNYKAKALQVSSLSVFITFIMFTQVAMSIINRTLPGVLGFATNVSLEEIINLTNQKRQDQGLPPLTLNSQLSQAAQQKGADMLAYDYWAHTSPDGKTPWSFITSSGYQYLYAGENLARDFYDSQAIVNAWMDSPTHRENILSSKYADIGIAIINGVFQGQETTLVVQMFGAQASAIVPLQTSQASTALASESQPIVSQVKAEKAPAQELKTGPALDLNPEPQKSYLLNSFKLTKNSSIIITLFLLSLVVIDTLVISQQKIHRLSGKGLPHLIFLSILLILLAITAPGVVL